MFSKSVMSFGLDGVNHHMFGLIGATRVCSSFRKGSATKKREREEYSVLTVWKCSFPEGSLFPVCAWLAR